MLSKNDQEEVTKITKTHPMDALEHHPFFVVRMINKQRIKLLLSLIGDVKEKIISDIGCEAGNTLSRIFKFSKPNKMYAVDLSAYALEKARELAKKEEWEKITDFVISDAESIKIPDETCDITISSNVLEHLNNPQKGFNELIRITKINGRIIVHLPFEKRIIFLKTIIKRIFPKLLGSMELGTPGHIHKPDKKFVTDLIDKCPYPVKLIDYQVGPKISIYGLYIYFVLEREKSAK